MDHGSLLHQVVLAMIDLPLNQSTLTPTHPLFANTLDSSICVVWESDENPFEKADLSLCQLCHYFPVIVTPYSQCRPLSSFFVQTNQSFTLLHTSKSHVVRAVLSLFQVANFHGSELSLPSLEFLPPSLHTNTVARIIISFSAIPSGLIRISQCLRQSLSVFRTSN